jgi:hypothetical protein
VIEQREHDKASFSGHQQMTKEKNMPLTAIRVKPALFTFQEV